MKRIFSVLLCLVLLLSILPAAVADEADGSWEELPAQADTRNFNAGNRPIVFVNPDFLTTNMTPADVTVQCESSGCSMYGWDICTQSGSQISSSTHFQVGVRYRLAFTLQANNSSNLFENGVSARIDFGEYEASATCTYISSDRYYASFQYDFSLPAGQVVNSLQITQINTPQAGMPAQTHQFATNNTHVQANFISWTDANGNTIWEFAANKSYILTLKLVPDENYYLQLNKNTVSATAGQVISATQLSDGSYQVRLLFTFYTPYTNPFVDVAKGKYYYDSVLWAYNASPRITSGTDDTHFSPNKSCTRAQVVTFLWRAFGCPTPNNLTNPFQDIKTDEYYYKAVLWAYSSSPQITSGTDSTHFSPNQGCTRAQVVTFLWRAEAKPNVSVSNPFTDVHSGEYYYMAVLWAVKNGVTKGDTASTFAPNKTCTRAEVVTFLYRVYGPKG